MAALQVKLDWFAFTFPIALLGDKDEAWTVSHILEMFEQHTGGRLKSALGQHLWTFEPSAGFYTHRIAHPILLCRINWRAGNSYAQCELSGQACDAVLTQITTSDLAHAANGRATRIDLAADIETVLTPTEFCGGGYSARIESTSLVDSPSGQTFYVGSRKGERMARVYRYNPPHPRANLLRIEVELKGDAAKMACEEMKIMDLSKLAQAANLTFDWQHPLWKDGQIMVSKIPARPYDRAGAETLRWLNSVVVPAIRKAHQAGLIDLPSWLLDNFHQVNI